jgi:preprotein translocase subunit SecD
MEEIAGTYETQIVKFVVSLICSLILASTAAAQAPATASLSSGTAAFTLSAGDVSNLELFMGKHIGQTMLRIAYTPEKQAEFTKIAGENLQKNVSVVLNGKEVSKILVIKAQMDTSLNVMMGPVDEATENEAFAIAKALVNSPPESGGIFPAADDAPAAGDVVFSLSSDEGISKVIVALFKDHTELDVTFPSHEKIEEYAKVTKDNIGKKLKVLLNGKLVQEDVIKAPGWGHVVKVQMPSPDEAFAMAKALIHPTPQTVSPTP